MVSTATARQLTQTLPDRFSSDRDLDCDRMQWRCPACQTAIKHNPADQGPQPGRRYRCHICRLELALDETTNRLDVPPLDIADDVPRPRGRSRP